MKKVLTTALVVLMVASSVFAGFSGSFETQYKADFAGKNYGFVNGPGSLKLTFDKVLGGTKNEAAITGKIGAAIAPKLDKEGDINLGLAITEASINGENWSVDLVKMAGVGDYANGVVGRYVDKDNPSVAPNLNAKVATTNGVTVNYDGWKLGLGMNFKAAGAETKKDIYVLASDALVPLTAENQKTILNADGKNYSKDLIGSTVLSYVKKEVVTAATAAKKELAATFTMKQLAFAEDSLKLDAYAGVYATGKKNIDLGFGANVAFAQDKISASVGTDMVVAIADKTKFNADVLAKFAYDFVNASVYYATEGAGFVKDSAKYTSKNLLDIAVGVDLKSFEVPLAFNFALADIVNDARRAIAFDVTSAFMEGAKVSANYQHSLVKDDHTWAAGVSAEYTLENIAKFSAGLKMDGAKKVDTVALTVAAENTTLIENTTLKLAYASENFLVDAKAPGAVTASVKVAF